MEDGSNTLGRQEKPVRDLGAKRDPSLYDDFINQNPVQPQSKSSGNKVKVHPGNNDMPLYHLASDPSSTANGKRPVVAQHDNVRGDKQTPAGQQLSQPVQNPVMTFLDFATLNDNMMMETQFLDKPNNRTSGYLDVAGVDEDA